MKNIYDLSLTELKRELEVLVEKMPRFRAGQIFAWLSDYKRFDEMSNIPNEPKEILEVFLKNWLSSIALFNFSSNCLAKAIASLSDIFCVSEKGVSVKKQASVKLGVRICACRLSSFMPCISSSV